MGNAGHVGMQADFSVLAHSEAQFVAIVDELKQRLQLVVAIRAAAEDVQHQVQLGRGGQGQLRCAHVTDPVCAVASP